MARRTKNIAKALKAAEEQDAIGASWALIGHFIDLESKEDKESSFSGQQASNILTQLLRMEEAKLKHERDMEAKRLERELEDARGEDSSSLSEVQKWLNGTNERLADFNKVREARDKKKTL
jgi:hypothetical protein